MFGKRIIIFYLLYVIGKGFGETYEIINSGLDSEKSTEKSIIENDNNNTRNSDDITTKHVGNAEDNSGNSKNNNLKSVVDTTEYDDRVTEDDVFSNNTEDGDTSSTYNNDNVKTSEIENFVDKKPKYDENNEDYTKNDDDDDDKEEVVEVEDELIYDEQYDEHGDKVKQHNSRSTILGEEMETCLTGYMTDVQNWVDKNGDLTCNIEKRFQLDVSKQLDAVTSLMRMIKLLRSRDRELRYISFAKCDLRRVPTVFHLQDTSGQALYSTVEYLTLYGNQFTDIGTAGEQFGEYMNATEAYKVTEGALQIPVTSAWSSGFNQVIFPRLKQLDLRRCSIQQLTYNVFKNMPNLEALYLGENSITYISGQAFYGLRSLMHLDISRNPLIYEAVGVSNLVFETTKVFSDLDKLTSLDLSWTQIRTRDVGVLSELPPRLQRLSICHGGLNMLPTGSFNNTSMKVLDISYNPGILNRYRLLEGLEDKLKVLYAKKISLKHFEHFHNYKQLIILDIFGNEITDIHPKTARSLQNLRILNLDGNRFATWFDPIFGFMSNLSLLSLRNNNVNLISNVMIEDFKNVSYIGLSENFIVCNCHTRELFELAYRNQNRTAPLITKSRFKIPGPFCYHSGFDDFNKLIFQRKNLTRYCDDEDPTCLESEDLEFEGDFLLFDFDPTLYNCLMVFEAKAVPFYHIDTCAQSKREIDFEEVIQDGWRLMFWLFIIPVVVFPILFFLYVFRRNLKYFCITIRNSATLSLINKDTVVNDDTIFNYDVFVSYCNEDRMWVLDQLLPHVEKDCNVSVCLHERDFQVGLSILENIVSCMDRSRSIMLVISQRFLLSQWCQFEMHLAQHRLLETRREDLILVLLEDIPRRLRPTTLHYLMLTKTYIVWPKNQADRHVFWKRLTRSILTHRTRGQENISLA